MIRAPRYSPAAPATGWSDIRLIPVISARNSSNRCKVPGCPAPSTRLAQDVSSPASDSGRWSQRLSDCTSSYNSQEDRFLDLPQSSPARDAYNGEPPPAPKPPEAEAARFSTGLLERYSRG